MNDTQIDKSGKLATVNARISPAGGLDILSRNEVARLRDVSGSGCMDCCGVARLLC
jgi:hypothetical protein